MEFRPFFRALGKLAFHRNLSPLAQGAQIGPGLVQGVEMAHGTADDVGGAGVGGSMVAGEDARGLVVKPGRGLAGLEGFALFPGPALEVFHGRRMGARGGAGVPRIGAQFGNGSPQGCNARFSRGCYGIRQQCVHGPADGRGLALEGISQGAAHVAQGDGAVVRGHAHEVVQKNMRGFVRDGGEIGPLENADGRALGREGDGAPDHRAALPSLLRQDMQVDAVGVRNYSVFNRRCRVLAKLLGAGIR